MSMWLQSIKRAILISRPIFWPSTFLVFLLGVVFSQSPITFSIVLWALLWSFPYSLWVSVINDLKDEQTDSLNDFKGGVSGAKTTQAEVGLMLKLKWFSLFLIAVPVFLTFNGWYWLTGAAALLIPYLYSAYPIRLKEKPPLDSLSNGAFVVCVLLAGYVINGVSTLEPILVNAIIALGLGVSALHMWAALRDFTPDKLTNTKTVAVIFGQKATALLSVISFIVILWLIRELPVEFVVTALGGLGLGSYLYFKPSEQNSFRAVIILMTMFFLAAGYSLVFNTWQAVIL